MDFNSLGYTSEESQMLSNMHTAITDANAWEWLRNFNGENGFPQSTTIQLFN